MRHRRFGNTGLTVSELGVGCSRIGGMWSAGGSRKEELAMLGAAVDAGITFFDTSDWYSQGQSELLVGKALRSRRSEVVIATKGGYVVARQRQLIARVKPVLRPIVSRLRRLQVTGAASRGAGGQEMAQDFSPAHLASAVEGSLRRLQTDYIDLYQLHSPPRSVIELGDYVGALTDLVEQGKIRHFGIAADAVADVVGVRLQPAVESLQVPFSLLHQDGAMELFPAAAEWGIGVIARSCYAAGLFKDGIAPETLRELTPDTERILALHTKADELGRPLLELALQFSLATAPIAVTILGMRTRAQLSDNLRCCASPGLSGAELAVLRESPHEVR